MSNKKRKKHAKKGAPPKKSIEIQTPPELIGWMWILFSLTLLLSLASFGSKTGADHWLGLLGYTLGWIFTGLFGLTGSLVALYIGWMGYRKISDKPIPAPLRNHACFALMIFSLAMLLTAFEDAFPRAASAIGHFFYSELWIKKLRFHLGGAVAFYLYKDMPLFNLSRIINHAGVFLLSTSAFFLSLMLLTRTRPETLWTYLRQLLQRTPQEPAFPSPVSLPDDDPLRFVKLRIPNAASAPVHPSQLPQPGDGELLEIKPDKHLLVRPSVSRKELKDIDLSKPFEGLLSKSKKKDPVEIAPLAPVLRDDPLISKPETPRRRKEAAIEAQKVYNGDFSNFKLPQTSLIATAQKIDQTSLKKDLRKQAEVLEETLLSFGIEAKVGQINCGPTITSFEVHPAIGVKVQKIKALENDIALNMEAKSIRILAPIPGKAAIGIEVPNPQPQEVGFKDMLNSYLQSGKKFHIPVLLGKTVTGEYVMEDLAKMPHVIIAGATGSGKSVCINTIVMSILMTARPDEIKLIMVDPKKVELTPYTKLPHMLAPVITEPAGACAALAWLVKEMEKRYEILKIVGFRNIAAFNTRKIDKAFEESLDKEIPEKMHYIVCIIDELADLMMVASNDMETYIARIAQMARAVGIHLILATQRPSREVITGLIKANFPTRIAFKVASRVNSQIILDEIGAECLLGNGDLLFLPPGSHHLIRAQGAYIRDQCINQVVESICSQAPANYVIQSFDHMEIDREFPDDTLEEGQRDSLYEQAVDIVMQTGNASTTFLQRKLKIGYARAASIMDQLEQQGIIGPAQGSKPRPVLTKEENPVD